MKLRKSSRKFLATGFLILLLGSILVFINSININTDIMASAYVETTSKDAMNIPSDFFFIDDDKSTFIDYCKTLLDTGSVGSIDDTTYRYYGTSNGYRLYRMGITDYPADAVNTEETIGGYVFSSPYKFRPYALGLYIVGDDGVYTLEQAYQSGIINIAQVYDLYRSKS